MSRITVRPTARTLPGGATAEGGEEEPLRIVPARHYGRWVSGVLIILLAAALANVVVRNEKIQYSVIPKYLFNSTILTGIQRTLLLTVLAMAIGVLLGIILAAMRLSANPVARATSWVYIWVMRGVPLLVQLLLWFNLGLLFPTLVLGVPGTHLVIAEWDTNSVITPFVAALLGLALNEGAWMAEVVRGGLLGVDRGQTEAAHALGMTGGLTLRRIILPQALRIAIPPTGNEVINMLKATALASVIGYMDLLGAARAIGNSTFYTIELLLVASIWYLVAVSILSIGQYYLERHYGRPLHGGERRSLRGVLGRGLRMGRSRAT